MSYHPSIEICCKQIFKPLEFDGFIYFQHVQLIMNTEFDIVAFAKTLSTELSKVADKGINITFNINVYTDSSEKKCNCHSNRKSLAIPKNSRFASRRPRPYETRKLSGGDLPTRVPLTGHGMNHGTVSPNPDSSNKTVESYDKSVSELADKSTESTAETEYKRILEMYDDYNKTYNRNLHPNESAPSHTETTDGKPVEDAEAPADNKTDTNTTKWRILYSGPVVDDNLPWRTYLTNRTYSTNQGYL